MRLEGRWKVHHPLVNKWSELACICGWGPHHVKWEMFLKSARESFSYGTESERYTSLRDATSKMHLYVMEILAK